MQKDFHEFKQDWDGQDRRKQPHDDYEQKCIAHTPALGPHDPITREYLDIALQDWRHASREYFNTHFLHLEELIRDGFPDGDPRSHREAHEGYIKRANSRSDMWQAVLKQVLTGTVWAGILAVSAAIWIQFKAEVHK